MSVTEETSHPERSPLKDWAEKNILDMSVTNDRSGASVARYTIFDAPLNACLMDSHCISPHCSIDCSFRALVPSPDKSIFVKSPDMLTV